MEQELRRDLTRTVLAVLIIGGLIAASLWILRPFLWATIWSAMIVVTTWIEGLYRRVRLNTRLGSRRPRAIASLLVLARPCRDLRTSNNHAVIASDLIVHSIG